VSYPADMAAPVLYPPDRYPIVIVAELQCAACTAEILNVNSVNDTIGAAREDRSQTQVEIGASGIVTGSRTSSRNGAREIPCSERTRRRP
jgi:hypothetical protein